jgi:hypothetical protein
MGFYSQESEETQQLEETSRSKKTLTDLERVNGVDVLHELRHSRLFRSQRRPQQRWIGHY